MVVPFSWSRLGKPPPRRCHVRAASIHINFSTYYRFGFSFV
jgi:hypothetical protein